MRVLCTNTFIPSITNIFSDMSPVTCLTGVQVTITVIVNYFSLDCKMSIHVSISPRWRPPMSFRPLSVVNLFVWLLHCNCVQITCKSKGSFLDWWTVVGFMSKSQQSQYDFCFFFACDLLDLQSLYLISCVSYSCSLLFKAAPSKKDILQEPFYAILFFSVSYQVMCE